MFRIRYRVFVLDVRSPCLFGIVSRCFTNQNPLLCVGLEYINYNRLDQTRNLISALYTRRINL